MAKNYPPHRDQGLAFLKAAYNHAFDPSVPQDAGLDHDNLDGQEYCLEQRWVIHDKKRDGVYISTKGRKAYRQFCRE